MIPTNPSPQIHVRVWTHSDLKALKWGSVLLGLAVGLFLPRGLRRYGRIAALVAGAFALKPLLALLREDSVLTRDRPVPADVPGDEDAFQDTREA